MPKSPENYYRPEKLDEALELLAKPDVVALGGGTKLLASESGLPVYGVVDLQALGLSQIRLAGNVLHIGATAKLTELAEFLQENLATAVSATLLQKAIKQAGPNTYRNAATLGGTIAAALPDSELLAALLVLVAAITLHNPEVTLLPLTDYLAAAAQPQGLITAVSIPITEGKAASNRVARTPADYPIVSITAFQPAREAPRLSATGIAERPLRLNSAEAELAGGLTETTVAAAAQSAQKTCIHPGDFRGDTAYRAAMAAVLTRRTLQELS
jgi:carbon-monoxide dehydrogenase medium subunit